MEKVLLILFIIAILTSFVASITDSIWIYYLKKYNKLLQEQNEILFKNLKIDNEILERIKKKSEVKSHE